MHADFVKLKDRWKQTIYVRRDDFESGKPMLRLYCANGLSNSDWCERDGLDKYRIGVSILRSNIHGTIERQIEQSKFDQLLATPTA